MLPFVLQFIHLAHNMWFRNVESSEHIGFNILRVVSCWIYLFTVEADCFSYYCKLNLAFLVYWRISLCLQLKGVLISLECWSSPLYFWSSKFAFGVLILWLLQCQCCSVFLHAFIILEKCLYTVRVLVKSR